MIPDKRKGYVFPGTELWYSRYPTFPSVAECVRLLQKGSHGAFLDCLCSELAKNAANEEEELIIAFQVESNFENRKILFAAMAEAGLPKAFDLFVEHLRSDDESLRFWSAEGLKTLNTKEARRVLWQAGIAVHQG